MFTHEAQMIIERAKDIATSWGAQQLTLRAIATSLVMEYRGVFLLAEGLETDQTELRRLFSPPEVL